MPEGGHPYIPNSAPAIRVELLRAIGAPCVSDLFVSVPERLRSPPLLDLPAAFPSELELERHVRELLERNRSTDDLLSFLGAGCWQHHVPAICDEIARRAEFLTAYWGNTYTDRGKYQAFFEYASLLGELLEMDAVSLPVYDWGSAAVVALRMAGRLTGRSEVVLAQALSPERRAVVGTGCGPDLTVIDAGSPTGGVDLGRLTAAIGAGTAAVYLENPSYLGVVEAAAADVAERAHAAGALSVVGVDPISLGVLAPPVAYGADIVCGELQGLGMHMDYGGGLAGFVATPDDERYIGAYPTFLIGIAPTDVPGEFGFGLVDWDRTSYMRREAGNDYGGTTTGLYAITAAVYLSLVGPDGLGELGAGILQRSHYAASELSAIPGVEAPATGGPFFKEFAVRFDGTGVTVAAVNEALLAEGILGGKDVSTELPELGQSALYCVTEVHTQADIDRLVAAVRRAVEAA